VQHQVTHDARRLPRFYIIFWLSYILVYLFWLCLYRSLCPNKDIQIINKQGYGLDRKGHGNAVYISLYSNLHSPKYFVSKERNDLTNYALT